MRDEKNFLEYRPVLDYEKAKIPWTPQSTPTLNDPVAASAPQIDPELILAKNLTSADILLLINQALLEVQNLIDEISTDLAGNVADGISFKEYINARALNDVDTKAAYESAHINSITGNTGMDLLPLLFDTKDELLGTKALVVNRFYQGTEPRDPDTAKQKETQEAQGMISAQLAGRPIDTVSVRMDNNLRDVLVDRVNGVRNLIRKAKNVLHGTLDQDTSGRMDELVQTIVNAKDYLNDLVDVNQMNFQVHVGDTAQNLSKINRLTPVSMRVGSLQMLSDLQKTALKYKPVTDYLANQNTSGGFHPSTVIVGNAATGLQQLHNSLDGIFSDCYKLNVLQGLQVDSFTQAADAKRNARQVHQLITTVQRHYDFTSSNTTQQINRMIQLQK